MFYCLSFKHLEPNRPKFLRMKNLLKQAIQKPLVKTLKKKIARCQKKLKDISSTDKTRPEVYSFARFSPLPLSDSVILDVAKI